MTITETFYTYVQAFEKTFVDDDWTRIEPFFTPDAVYLTADGQEIGGRDNVLAYLKGSLDAFDRRFASRQVSLVTEPVITADQVSFQWRAAYAKSGAPDLVIIGSEVATFDDGAISRLEDSVEPAVAQALESWIEAYGEFLGDDANENQVPGSDGA